MLASAQPATAQPMPVEQVKKIMSVTAKNWVAFRNYSGRQLIYFSQILAWHCGLTEIRYSIDNNLLDQRFPVPKCNPNLPNNIGPDTKIYLERPIGSVNSVAIQLMYSDGTASDTHVLGPCPDVGEATCAVLLESQKALSGAGGQQKSRPSTD